MNDYREVHSGVWVPSGSVIEFPCANTEADVFGEAMSICRITVDIEASRFNSPVDGAVFDLAFPGGMEVSDRVRGIAYVVGKETEEATLTSLATQGRIGMEALSKHVPHGREPNSHATVQLTLIIGANALLVCLVLAGLFYRRRQQARRSP